MGNQRHKPPSGTYRHLDIQGGNVSQEVLLTGSPKISTLLSEILPTSIRHFSQRRSPKSQGGCTIEQESNCRSISILSKSIATRAAIHHARVNSPTVVRSLLSPVDSPESSWISPPTSMWPLPPSPYPCSIPTATPPTTAFTSWRTPTRRRLPRKSVHSLNEPGRAIYMT